MSGPAWNRVADGVYQRRYQPLDVSVVAVVGPSGVIVADTRNNPAEAEDIIADTASAFGLPIVAVVNTHAHYDHTFGNQRFRFLPIYGHSLLPRHFAAFEGPRLAAQQADPHREPDKDWADVVLTPANRLIRAPTTVCAGGRTITLLPQAPGHTDTDLVVFIPDQRVWLVGDLVEESGPPMYGSGSFPFGWPRVLTRLLGSIEPGDPVVPGHGAVVDRAFVAAQTQLLESVAAAIRYSWNRRLSPGDALPELVAACPWPEATLESALAQGYAQLDAGTPAGFG